jgi:hypothetical protein
MLWVETMKCDYFVPFESESGTFSEVLKGGHLVSRIMKYHRGLIVFMV